MNKENDVSKLEGKTYFFWMIFAFFVYFLVYAFAARYVTRHGLPKELNSLGDSISGFTAPLAFILVSAAFFIQARELRAQIIEMRETQRIMDKQAAEMRETRASVQKDRADDEDAEKKRCSLRFFAEFCSREMSERRNEALAFVKANPGAKLHGLGSTKERESIPVWVVARFFESLWVHIKNGVAHDATAMELHGFLFLWWHEYYLAEGLREDWEITIHLREFRGWLENHAKPEDFERWLAIAVKDRANVGAHA